MTGNKYNRPAPDGSQRVHYDSVRNGRRTLPNVRWRCGAYLVHQASMHNNRTLCEMGSSRFVGTLHLPILGPTKSRVNCVECMAYPTWHEYPID